MWDGGPYTGWRLTSSYFKIGDGTSNHYRVSALTSLTSLTWHQVVGTYKQGSLRLYLDGQLNNELNIDVLYANGSGGHSIGRYAGSAYYLNGKIQNVKVYNRALSEQEIKLMYELDSGKSAMKQVGEKIYIRGQVKEV
jgi:hypothetical protein